LGSEARGARASRRVFDTDSRELALYISDEVFGDVVLVRIFRWIYGI